MNRETSTSAPMPPNAPDKTLTEMTIVLAASFKSNDRLRPIASAAWLSSSASSTKGRKTAVISPTALPGRTVTTPFVLTMRTFWPTA